MLKVLQGFILKNGFEGKVGEVVGEDKFGETELQSLITDGSLEEMKDVAEEKLSIPEPDLNSTLSDQPSSSENQPQENVDPNPQGEGSAT